LHGISQNPDTSDYILVFNWTSGNEKIDDFIQEKKLKCTLFKWIPYNQFNEISKIDKNDIITVYSAIWKDSPLQYNQYNNNSNNKKVALKCLHNSKDPIEFVVNEV
jgi:hypothetical protein